MMKTAVILAGTLALGACGGSQYASDNAYKGAVNVPYTGAVNTVDLGTPPVGAATVEATTVSAPTPPRVRFASGPIQKACQSSDRKARSRARCGCIQAVANDKLSGADQRRGAKYWRDPGKLQEVRQSDNPGNERFWKVWKAYGQTAAAQCKGT